MMTGPLCIANRLQHIVAVLLERPEVEPNVVVQSFTPSGNSDIGCKEVHFIATIGERGRPSSIEVDLTIPWYLVDGADDAAILKWKKDVHLWTNTGKENLRDILLEMRASDDKYVVKLARRITDVMSRGLYCEICGRILRPPTELEDLWTTETTGTEPGHTSAKTVEKRNRSRTKGRRGASNA